MKKHLWTFIGWLGQSCHTQLFVTLISLPILVGWGIPLSLLGFAGNIIFSPLLLIFLLLSSCIFFLELVYLPNRFFIILLEYVVSLWSTIISWGPAHSLYNIPRPAWWVAPLLILSVCMVVHHTALQSLRRSLCALSLLFMLTMGYLLRPIHVDNPVLVPCGKGSVRLFYNQGKAILIDTGFMTGVRSIDSWVDYTLVPEIIKNTGIHKLDAIIILKPSANCIKALERLLQTIPAKKVYVPLWQGYDKRLARGLFFTKRILEEHGGVLLEYGQNPCSGYLEGDWRLTFLPCVDKQMRYGFVRYASCEVILQVDGNRYRFSIGA